MVSTPLVRRILSAIIVVVVASTVAVLVSNVQGSSKRTPVMNRSSAGLTTEFSYQGYLALEGQPVNGLYDFRVRLYDAQADGAQIGSENIVESVDVQTGVFSVYLNFGDVFNGRPRWLEIDVRQHGDEDTYITLTPRQEINPVPYALYAESTLEMWEFNTMGVDPDTGLVNGAYPDVFTSVHHQGPQRVVLVEAPVIAKQIEALYLIVVNRNGSYDGTYSLEFEVRSYDGTLQHVVSAAPVDLQEVSTHEVIEIAMSSNPDDMIVLPGEYLAITIRRSGEPGGSLMVNLSTRVLGRNALQTSARGQQ
ncbi:hypothetical protein EYB53_023125 [Candidatus Chloroploca sp. M-50]|uniref:Uncharacterized protein n=1 Tax=Candidatus Chloroploca mongolica TaxID=2528176 RepID=A0ABS4DGR3_9CHLR|nr:hypothetical protein [Candidatus Chloroploca mongolica]MBP1468625.1 hypothetical protein [Candidatus Chloroploca mongolica]